VRGAGFRRNGKTGFAGNGFGRDHVWLLKLSGGESDEEVSIMCGAGFVHNDIARLSHLQCVRQLQQLRDGIAFVGQ
jgi:hypothetical protein